MRSVRAAIDFDRRPRPLPRFLGGASVGVAILLAGVLTASASAAAASATPSIHCPAPAAGQGPKNDRSLPIGDVTAGHMSCDAVHRAIRRGSFSVHGACFGIPGVGPCRSTFKTQGFRCTAPSLGTFRCKGAARRFSFGWSE